MSTGPDRCADAELTADERSRLEALRESKCLDDLVELTGAASLDQAYFAAKREWFALRDRELTTVPPARGIPGNRVVVDGHEFWVHGITHAETDEERAFLVEHVSRLLEAGASVYCEQGIRSMYFADIDGVCEMDDYRWAMNECAALEGSGTHSVFSRAEFDALGDEIDSLRSRLRKATFSLIESSEDRLGERFAAAIGDLASTFFASHERLATGIDFESFRRSKAAAANPDHLAELQHYYEKAFLPQPIEREWLRRHDPELEIITHARNERMADYAVYHNETSEVHLIVGAAHQPGVTYYLERHRDGERTVDDFEPVG